MPLRLNGCGSNQDADSFRDQSVDREREELRRNPPNLIVTSASIEELFLAIQPDEKSKCEAEEKIASQARSV